MKDSKFKKSSLAPGDENLCGIISWGATGDAMKLGLENEIQDSYPSARKTFASAAELLLLLI